MKKALAIVGLASCFATTGHAADTSQVPEGLLACAKIQDAAARVRCYDAQVAAMKKASGRASPAAAPAASERAAAASSAAAPAAGAPAVSAPAVSAPASSSAGSPAGSAAPSGEGRAPAQPAAQRENPPVAQFGEEELPPSRRPKSSHRIETLASSITGVTRAAEDVYYFSLANGQVWRANVSNLSFGSQVPVLFRVGAPIRIQRGALGDYHMWAPAVGAKNWMYVSRIR